MKSEIRYLLRKDIELDKWNGCIRNSINGLCYSDSEYLDAVATDWSALVMGDYQAVMPLVQRRKFGIDYLYQPSFCQQTGITMREGDPTDHFLSSIPMKFKYWDIQLNWSNSTSLFPSTQRKNYLLSLAPDETELSGRFDRNATRNIRKAHDKNITVREDIPASILLQLHTARFAKRNNTTLEEYKAFETLLDHWSRSSRAKIFGAQDSNGNVIASSGYLFYGNRITFVINGNNAESLTAGATHLLKDYVIRKYAGSGYFLDFEGSDNPDFSRFYRQFGADICEYYSRILNNRLPWPVKWLKR